MAKKTAHLSDMRPEHKPWIIDCGKIPAFQYQSDLKKELTAKTITKEEAINLLEDMLFIREFEEMIVKLRSGAYEPLPGYNYRGPTHVSIGQEGCAAGGCCLLTLDDK